MAPDPSARRKELASRTRRIRDYQPGRSAARCRGVERAPSLGRFARLGRFSPRLKRPILDFSRAGLRTGSTGDNATARAYLRVRLAGCRSRQSSAEGDRRRSVPSRARRRPAWPSPSSSNAGTATPAAGEATYAALGAQRLPRKMVRPARDVSPRLLSAIDPECVPMTMVTRVVAAAFPSLLISVGALGVSPMLGAIALVVTAVIAGLVASVTRHAVHALIGGLMISFPLFVIAFVLFFRACREGACA